MSSFGEIMERHAVKKIFHAVRIFNIRYFLYAYVELFNTFQYYILLSEKYNFAECGDIDESDGNIIEMNEPIDKDLCNSLTPRDFKDMDIIQRQYDIDMDKLLEGLKQYRNYDCLDSSKQVNMLFNCIGKRAYEKIRKQAYIKKYNELINQHYDSIDFLKIFLSSNNNNWMIQYKDFQFYTILDDDCVNIKKYKKILPDGSDYPTTICKFLNSGQDLKAYGHMKFHMLTNRTN